MPIEFAPPSPSLQGFQIAPPQSTDPLQTLAQMGQLRTQNLQQQGAQQELQANQLKYQQAQEDYQDQQKLRKVYTDWLQSGNTKTDDLLKQAAGAGVGPRTLMPLQQQLLEHRTKLATADKLDFENTVSKQAQTTQSLNAVASAPPDQRPVAWQTERANLINKGYAQPGDIPEQYPGDVAFEELRHHNRTSEQELALAKEQREAKSAAATTAGTEATTAETVLKTKELQKQLYWLDSLTPKTLADYVGASIDKTKYPDLYARALNDATNARAMRKPELMQQAIDKYATIASEQEKTIATETDPRVAQARTNQAVATARATTPIKIDLATGMAKAQLGAGVGGTGTGGPNADLHGEDFLKTLNPTLAARVKQIATGNEPLPTGRAAMSGPGALLANAVYQYDPQYTPLLAQKRREMLSDYTKTSGAGGNILALQTFIHHADLYQETADALANGTFKPGNAAWNAVKETFGKAPPVQADLVAQFLAGETAKVAGENTGGAVNEILSRLKSSNSPEQIRAAGQSLMGIAAGRLIPHKERIADAHLEGLVPPLVGPSEREILARRGFDVNTLKPAAAGGTGGQLQYVRTATKGGHTIGQTADGKWHDVQTGALIQ